MILQKYLHINRAKALSDISPDFRGLHPVHNRVSPLQTDLHGIPQRFYHPTDRDLRQIPEVFRRTQSTFPVSHISEESPLHCKAVFSPVFFLWNTLPEEQDCIQNQPAISHHKPAPADFLQKHSSDILLQMHHMQSA